MIIQRTHYVERIILICQIHSGSAMTNTPDLNAHPNYELLNLLGYGLAKFGLPFIREFGFKTKTAFYNHFVQLKIVETGSVVKNRQDLFDAFFDNGRKGWWQKGDAYIHRKIAIDTICGNMNVTQFATYVKGFIADKRYIEIGK
jgi:hypothetical protein